MASRCRIFILGVVFLLSLALVNRPTFASSLRIKRLFSLSSIHKIRRLCDHDGDGVIYNRREVDCLSRFSNFIAVGEIAYTMKQISPSVLEFDVTNGVYLLKARTSAHSDELVSCSIYRNVVKSQRLVQSDGVQIDQIGQKKIQMMLQKCRQSRLQRKRATTSDDGGDPFNHDIAKGKPFVPDFGTGAPSGPGSHFAIYPGTKWCGYENVAKNMTDLGEHRATDACCRTHDHCPYYIDRFESKYHYYNAYPWTISYCDCDQHLFDCLTKTNTQTSNAVGKLFFGLLDVQCFTFQQGSYCEDTSSFISKLWCSKTVSGTRAVMQKFPHKWGESDNQNDATVVG